jgi:hypothetical protein
MAGGGRAQLRGGFGQGDVEARLVVPGALAQELQAEGGLARAGGALDEIGVAADEAAGEHVIKPSDAGAGPILACSHVIGSREWIEAAC